MKWTASPPRVVSNNFTYLETVLELLLLGLSVLEIQLFPQLFFSLSDIHRALYVVRVIDLSKDSYPFFQVPVLVPQKTIADLRGHILLLLLQLFGVSNALLRYILIFQVLSIVVLYLLSLVDDREHPRHADSYLVFILLLC